VVGNLCKELGITRPTIYRYVGPEGKLREYGKREEYESQYYFLAFCLKRAYIKNKPNGRYYEGYKRNHIESGFGAVPPG
jgi:hypothetical protein